MDPHRRAPGYSGGRDWAWRMALGTGIGSVGGIVASAVGISAGLVSASRGAASALAANAVLASACLAGCEEVVRELRSSNPQDPTNGLLGGAVAGYTMGSLRGGHSLALPSAVAFCVIGFGLHHAVWTVQEWRLRQIHEALSQDSDQAADLVKPLLRSSTNESNAGISSQASGIDDASEGQLSLAKKEGWSWPEWMPIRPATQEEIRKSQSMHEKLRRERFGDDTKTR